MQEGSQFTSSARLLIDCFIEQPCHRWRLHRMPTPHFPTFQRCMCRVRDTQGPVLSHTLQEILRTCLILQSGRRWQTRSEMRVFTSDFSTVGFQGSLTSALLPVKNHSISDQTIQGAFYSLKVFSSLPAETKIEICFGRCVASCLWYSTHGGNLAGHNQDANTLRCSAATTIPTTMATCTRASNLARSLSTC